MNWGVPGFSIGGLELVRSTIAPVPADVDDHGREWVIFGSPLNAATGRQGVAIAGDFHQISSGILLGCSAHMILEAEVQDDARIAQDVADDVAAELGPWVCEALWDFMAMHLRSLAAAGWADFDIPKKAPKPEVERLASQCG